MIESGFRDKSTNLNVIKFVAAFLVIFSHSFTVVGESGGDPFGRITIGQLSFGELAVAVFFFVSGFFVTKSLAGNPQFKAFWKRRLVRIYPSFITVMLITAFILGPAVSSLSLKDYLTSHLTYQYLEYLLFIPRYHLPGVFETNPISLVNGSLWTLILEMLCYITLFLIFTCKIPEQRSGRCLLIVCFFASVVFIFGYKYTPLFRYKGYLRPAFIFAVGMLFYLYQGRIRLKLSLGLAAVIAGAVIIRLNYADLAMILIFPYVLSIVIFSDYQLPAALGKLGDYSYGIYLCGFPTQQTLEYLFPEMGYISNTIWAFIISILISFGIYHLIEVPVNKKYGIKKHQIK